MAGLSGWLEQPAGLSSLLMASTKKTKMIWLLLSAVGHQLLLREHSFRWPIRPGKIREDWWRFVDKGSYLDSFILFRTLSQRPLTVEA
jgi:hypothetical protein